MAPLGSRTLCQFFLPLCYAHMLSFCPVILSQQLPTMLTLCSPSQFKFPPKINACRFQTEIDGSLQSGSKYCDPWLGSSVSHCQTSKKLVSSIPGWIQITLPALTALLFPKLYAGILCVSLGTIQNLVSIPFGKPGISFELCI